MQCSGGWPCETCFRHQSSRNRREPTHAWMECVPFSLKTVNIFDRALFKQDFVPLRDKRSFRRDIKAFDLRLRETSFTGEWYLYRTIQWLGIPTTSGTAINIANPDLKRLTSYFFGADFFEAWSMFILASSITSRLYKVKPNSSILPALLEIQCAAGSAVLHKIDQSLRDAQLAKASLDEFITTFLILIGVASALRTVKFVDGSVQASILLW